MRALPPPVATPAPTLLLTCSRCGLADIAVVTRDNGIPHHVTPMKCIAALKAVAATESAMVVCGPVFDEQKVKGSGCGKPIVRGEEYRCLDCGAVMHRDCLRRHCSADEKDALIAQLQSTIRRRDEILEELAALVPERT